MKKNVAKEEGLGGKKNGREEERKIEKWWFGGSQTPFYTCGANTRAPSCNSSP